MVMIVVAGDLLPPDDGIVVIPLLRDCPMVRHVNPAIRRDGQRLVLAPRPVGAVRRSGLRRAGNAASDGDAITRAIDVGMGGF